VSRSNLGCDDVRPLAPDVALDLLTGDERAAALEHLGACAACRLEVEELSSVADSLLVLSPSIPPSAGFESSVLARMEAEWQPPAAPERQTRRWVGAAIVVVGLVIGAGLLVAAPRPDSGIRRATFVAADGRPAGDLLIAEGDPDRMTCTLDDPRFTGPYTVELELHDGSRREVGGFRVDDGGSAVWATELPVDDDLVRAVEVLSPEGEVRSQARL
jgi:hypothetical protein